MKKKYEFGIVIHYTIVVPPPYAIRYIAGASYEKSNGNYKPEPRNIISTNTVCKNKFT